MKNFQPEEVIVERGSEGSPIYQNLRRTLPQLPFRFVDDIASANGGASAVRDSFGSAKKKLYLAKHKGEFLKKCPGSEGQVCCNYFVINFASNCPMDCSYCYLQEYLADNSALKVFSNVGDLIDEADATLKKHRGVFFRIGTGEITDSLALEPYTGMVREILPYFAEQPNVLLELKTKSDCVDSLLDLDPKGRVVVGWSMNPQRVIDADEHATASLAERLNAARRVQAAGYRLGFHFDPMIEYPGWEADYHAMLEADLRDHRLAQAFLGQSRRPARHAGLEADHARALSTQPVAHRRAGALSRRQAALLSAAADSKCTARWLAGFAALRQR